MFGIYGPQREQQQQQKDMPQNGIDYFLHHKNLTCSYFRLEQVHCVKKAGPYEISQEKLTKEKQLS